MKTSEYEGAERNKRYKFTSDHIFWHESMTKIHFSMSQTKMLVFFSRFYIKFHITIGNLKEIRHFNNRLKNKV